MEDVSDISDGDIPDIPDKEIETEDLEPVELKPVLAKIEIPIDEAMECEDSISDLILEKKMAR